MYFQLPLVSFYLLPCGFDWQFPPLIAHLFFSRFFLSLSHFFPLLPKPLCCKGVCPQRRPGHCLLLLRRDVAPDGHVYDSAAPAGAGLDLDRGRRHHRPLHGQAGRHKLALWRVRAVKRQHSNDKCFSTSYMYHLQEECSTLHQCV